MADGDFVIKKEEEVGLETAKVDKPANKPKVTTTHEAQGLANSAKLLLETFANAKIGRRLFSDYAIEYQLKDSNTALYFIFMVIGYLFDMFAAVFVFWLIAILLIAFVFVTLRGFNAWTETVHIAHFMAHDIWLILGFHFTR